MDFPVLFVLPLRADSRVLSCSVRPAVGCCEVDRIVLVSVLEEAPDDRVYPGIGKDPRTVRAASEKRSCLLSVWENVWIFDRFFWENAWNPYLALPARAVLENLATEEAI